MKLVLLQASQHFISLHESHGEGSSVSSLLTLHGVIQPGRLGWLWLRLPLTAGKLMHVVAAAAGKSAADRSYYS